MRGNQYNRIPWKNFINEKNKHLINDEGLDLLDKMLQYDKNLRIRPKDAMAHKYFDIVREFAK
jgi:casein kinase II subunit alpha